MELRTNSSLAVHYGLKRRNCTVEKGMKDLFIRGQSNGSILNPLMGEEAAKSAVNTKTRERYTCTTHHCGHCGHCVFLGRAADPRTMMAEITGEEASTVSGFEIDP